MPYNPTDHISVYSRPRPMRIVFLIDINDCPAEMQIEILDFCSNLWGGRFNPIIPIDKRIIPPGYWNLMRFYDPDIVYSYTKLSDDLIRKIDVEISPYHFIIHKVIHDNGYKFRPSIHGDLLHVDFSVVPKGIFNPFGENFSFLICHNRSDWEYYLFFQTNFGIYNDQHMYQPPSKLERLVVPEKSSPEVFLEQIADKRKGVIYPWQFTISDIPFKQLHDGKSYVHDCFTISVGDSLWNWLYMWNKIFILSTWKKSEINQFYIPLSIIKSERLQGSIKKLISIHAHRSGSHPPTVVFASFDIGEDELSEISKKLTERIDAFPKTKRIPSDFDELKDLDDKSWLSSPKFPQHDYVSGNKFYLKRPQPSLRGKLDNGKWIADFKIEYHPQRFLYTNISYWWKLPRMHSLARCFLESGMGGGRIDSEGHLSVIVGGDANSDLCFRIPDDREIIHTLLIQDRQPYFTDDIRYKAKPAKPFYDHIQLSDKGRYLNGYLNLVGNLFNAGSLVEHHFWRTVFNTMCGVDTQNESNVSTSVKNKLNKFVPRWFSNMPSNSEKTAYFSRIVEILSHLTIRFGRHLKNPSPDITFSRLLKLFEEERQAFIKMPGHEKGFETNSQRNRQDLLEALEELTSSKILIQGVKPSCPRCGFQTWYSADEVKFELTCNGCQFVMQILPEIEWVYRLNSLVQDAIRYHGTIPVVWVLSQLLHWSRESFIFRPCLELREDYEGRILAEVDIACVSDGKFIIGEIKTKASQFSSNEIQKLCTVARNVLPQQVIIGAFDPPYDFLKDVAREIAEKLKDLGIQVQVKCPSGQINEPEYHPYY